MKTLDAKQLNELIDDTPVFDVRGDEAYRKEHIPGAKSAPLGSLEMRVNEVLDKDSKVVVHCTNPQCELSKEAAERLENLGYSNVYRFVDGIQGWKSAGFQTASS